MPSENPERDRKVFKQLHPRLLEVRLLLLILLLAISGGCYRPGGGGTTHHPPGEIRSGQSTDLKLTFGVWGAGTGRLDRRYTDVVCIYQINPTGPEHRVRGKVVTADDKNMEMLFTIPPLDLKSGDSVQYRFEMLFDGYQNSRATEILNVK